MQNIKRKKNYAQTFQEFLQCANAGLTQTHTHTHTVFSAVHNVDLCVLMLCVIEVYVCCVLICCVLLKCVIEVC